MQQSCLDLHKIEEEDRGPMPKINEPCETSREVYVHEDANEGYWTRTRYPVYNVQHFISNYFLSMTGNFNLFFKGNKVNFIQYVHA